MFNGDKIVNYVQFYFSLKTTLFKWSPDHASAANHYEKAGIY